MGLFDLARAALLYNKRVDVKDLQMDLTMMDIPGLLFAPEGENLTVTYMNVQTGRTRKATIPIQNGQVLLRDLMDAYARVELPADPPRSPFR